MFESYWYQNTTNKNQKSIHQKHSTFLPTGCQGHTWIVNSGSLFQHGHLPIFDLKSNNSHEPKWILSRKDCSEPLLEVISISDSAFRGHQILNATSSVFGDFVGTFYTKDSSTNIITRLQVANLKIGDELNRLWFKKLFLLETVPQFQFQYSLVI